MRVCSGTPREFLAALGVADHDHFEPALGGAAVRAYQGILSDPAAVKFQYWISPDELPAPSDAQTWFAGHLHFGHHLIYNAQPVYFTILRDPIERLISEFFNHHHHPQPGIYIPDDQIVPAFIRMVEAAPQLNYYSYMFSDYCAQKEAAHQGLAAWDGNPTTGFELVVARNKRYGVLTENVAFECVNVGEALRRASKNLHAMRFIGFFDRLNDAACDSIASSD